MGKEGRTFAQAKMGSGRILAYRSVGYALSGCVLASALISVLFYNSPFGMCSFPVLLVLAGKYEKARTRKREERELNLEFKEYMHAVSASLAAGNAAERAFAAALDDVSVLFGGASVLQRRLGAFQSRLSMQEPMEHILRDFSKSCKSEEIETFVEIFCCAKRGGGDFIHIIEVSVERICDRMDILEEIQTVMAQKALEQKVMCVVPIGILLFFRLTSPEFIGRLYGNPFGIFVMTAALLLYGLACFLGVKILEVEV